MTTALVFSDGIVRSLQMRGQCLYNRQMQLDFVSIESTRQNRDALEHLSIPYVLSEESALIVGEHAVKYTGLFQVPLQSLMPGGHIPINDPPARQLLAHIIESILPASPSGGALCCINDDQVNSRKRLSAEQTQADRLIEQLIKLRGYRRIAITSSRAVLLAELVNDRFTGLAIHVQPECVHACLARQGMTLMDEELPMSAEMRALLSRTTADISDGCEGAERRDAVRQMLTQLSHRIGRYHHGSGISRPVTAVIAGGATSDPELQVAIQAELAACELPIELGRVRFTNDRLVVARGCLIHAELELRATTSQRAA